MLRLSLDELAAYSGVDLHVVAALVDRGLISPGPDGFGEGDVRKVRLLEACDRAGLPLEAIAELTRSGRLSLSFLDQPPFQSRFTAPPDAAREPEPALAPELIALLREASGFAPRSPGERATPTDEALVALLEAALEIGLPLEGVLRLIRVYGEGLTRIVETESHLYREYVVDPLRVEGMAPGQAMEHAPRRTARLVPLLEEALLTIYRRQQERSWTQVNVEEIEAALAETGFRPAKGRIPAVAFVDLTGYTRRTVESGDAEAARISAVLTEVVHRVVLSRDVRPVKWLGDGAMLVFPTPSDGVRCSLEIADEVVEHGLPPTHSGIDAGPVLYQDGDYFGRTVNRAARITDVAGPAEVLVSEPVVEAAAGEPDLTFRARGSFQLEGLPEPVTLFAASSPSR